MTSQFNQSPEQLARDRIDAQLRQAGWAVQAKNRIDLHASRAAKRFCRSGLARDQPYRKSIARPQRFPTAAALPTPRGSHARSSDAAREVKP